MSIALHVSLLSGRTVQIETGLGVQVWEFNRRAQRVLSVGKGRLVHSTGLVLDEAKTIGDSDLGNEDFLNMQIQPTMIQATRANHAAAFAVVLGDRSVVTWGNATGGAESSAVRDQLKNVQQIQASLRAFAAILADGSVLTWGNADSGATAVQCKINSRMCSRFKPVGALLQPSLLMDLW